jgi:hypothetical protein
MHITAIHGWTYFHVDEIRAFLNAAYKGGPNPIVTKFHGGKDYFQVKGALYGLKTSPRDYQQTVITRLNKLGFTQLQLCPCIFTYREGNDLVVVYDYVDDFIILGNNRDLVMKKIQELRGETCTTEPIENAERILGMEIRRDFEKKIMLITMTKKIDEVCTKFDIHKERIRHTPMPNQGYLITDSDFEQISTTDSQFLDKKGIEQYMALVGSLVWISGIRMDIQFATMYLTWATQNPRVHHMKMGKCVCAYLHHTRDIPLIIGGDHQLINEKEEYAIKVTGYTDASLGTGPKGRSIKAEMFKLSPQAGAITSRSGASTSVFLSSFEAELDGIASGFKTASRINNILQELNIVQHDRIVDIYNDNKAMLNFIQGEGLARGVRHIALRMYYTRQKYQEGNIQVHYLEGTKLPADQQTKIGTKAQFIAFRHNILGLSLWDNNSLSLIHEEDYEDD